MNLIQGQNMTLRSLMICKCNMFNHDLRKCIVNSFNVWPESTQETHPSHATTLSKIISQPKDKYSISMSSRSHRLKYLYTSILIFSILKFFKAQWSPDWFVLFIQIIGIYGAQIWAEATQRKYLTKL